MKNMNDPSLRLPEPSLPEHNLLREAGSLPQLSSGLRDRVILNCHQQVRYGRWADRLRACTYVAAACLLVCVVWNFRGKRPEPVRVQNETVPSYPTAQHDATPYSSHDAIQQESDKNANPLPMGGPSMRRDMIPEVQELNQMIEKLQGRQNVLCGLLPYL